RQCRRAKKRWSSRMLKSYTHLALGLAVGAVALGAPAVQGATFHFSPTQNDVAFGRIMQGSTPASSLTLARNANGTNTSNFSYSSNGITGPANVSANGSNVPAPIGVSLLNNANGTATLGAGAWAVSMVSNATAAQRTAVNLSATVVSN